MGDDGPRWILVICMLSMAGGGWRRSRSAHALKRQGDAFVRRNLAIVEERFVPAFDVRLRREQQVTVVCALVGAALLAVIPLGSGDPLLPLLAIDCAVISLLVVGRGLVWAWSAAQPFVDEPGIPRLARLRSMAPADLVSPWLRWPSRIGASASVAGATWVLMRHEMSGEATAIAGFAVLSLGASLVATEVVARRACTAAEPAVDTAQLYWQDALRADDLSRSHLDTLQAAGLLVMSGVVATWMSGLDDDSYLLLGSGLAVALLVAGAVGYLVWSRGTNPWFRRRLWPDLARGEVIAPGRKVAA